MECTAAMENTIKQIQRLKLTMSKIFGSLSLQVLAASRTLYRAWRVGYVQADNELAPRKPLYLWRDHFKNQEMAQNSCIRLF